MNDTFSNIERILLELLALPGEDEMCDYIIEEKISQTEILEIAKRLSLSDEALDKLSIKSSKKQKPRHVLLCPKAKNKLNHVRKHQIHQQEKYRRNCCHNKNSQCR